MLYTLSNIPFLFLSIIITNTVNRLLNKTYLNEIPDTFMKLSKFALKFAIDLNTMSMVARIKIPFRVNVIILKQL